MPQASARYIQLATGPRDEVQRAFEAGEAPSPSAIAGFEFRGYNRIWIAPLLRIRKFIKVFFTIPEAGDYGCNTPAAQTPVDADWIARPEEGSPRRFGFYAIGRDDGEAQRRHPQALLLDYGRGRNPWYQPARFLRDYLVRVSPGSDDLLLGKAYLALGALRIPLGFFVLERRRPIPDQPRLPR